MIDVEKARQRILDLAIRGKLVPQDPNDEPASVLLERIREEQIKLHREGKIKKLPEFSYIYRGSDNRYYEKRGNSCQDITNEIPFELPPTWVWARVGSISNYGSAISANNEDINDSDWVLELEDIEGYSSKLLVKERKGSQMVGSTKHRFRKGDLLISKLRMYLKKVLVADEDGFCSSEIMPTSFLPSCQNEFAKLFYVSPYLLTRVDQLQYGCKMPRLGTKDGRNLLFPLPPEKEQKRIINKVTEIDSLLMRIGTLDNELQRLSLLLKRKVLSTVFSSDKSYYSKKLSTVADITMGQSVPSEKMHAHSQEGDLEFHQGKTCFSSCGLLFSGVFTAEYKKVSLPNSVLLSMRAPVGAVIINDRTIAVGRGLCSIRPTPSLDLYYLFWYLTLIEKELVKQATGTTFLAIGVEVVRNIEIPIPPIDHQRHIASLIERANYFLKAIAAV